MINVSLVCLDTTAWQEQETLWLLLVPNTLTLIALSLISSPAAPSAPKDFIVLQVLPS